jgi:hypothetical protein
VGKYSLENYSFYETYKIRPKPLARLQGNPERGMYRLLSYRWEELEPERGKYCMERLKEELAQGKNTILKISGDTPSWMEEANNGKETGLPGGNREEGFAHLVRRVGSFPRQLPDMVGVIITPGIRSKRVWDAYMEAFADLVLLADLEEEELIRYLKENGKSFGLMVNCSEALWITCCEQFAKLGLQHTWEKNPVVLSLQDKEAGPHIIRESARWHAAFANRPMDIGYDFTLRRLTFPKKITGKGGLPVRFWFVNTGSAPCYKEFALMLRLWRDGAAWEFRLNIDHTKWGVGDITHNEIIPLPELEEGSYQVSIGIFFSDEAFPELRNDQEITSNSILKEDDVNRNSMHKELEAKSWIFLNIQAEEHGGYYRMGEIEVDNQIGNNLLYAWDHFYPDGYYPLEDPKEPKEG